MANPHASTVRLCWKLPVVVAIVVALALVFRSDAPRHVDVRRYARPDDLYSNYSLPVSRSEVKRLSTPAGHQLTYAYRSQNLSWPAPEEIGIRGFAACAADRLVICSGQQTRIRADFTTTLYCVIKRCNLTGYASNMLRMTESDMLSEIEDYEL